MKRIRFIAPVEAIQGNMSGNQKLQYAEHNNPAFESPKGKRNYARNYRPSYIGAFVAGTGTKYFAVKTKTAVHLTNKSQMAMALAGAAGAMFGSLIKDKTSVLYLQAEALWINNGISAKQTMRKFYTNLFRQMLAAKSASISVTDEVTQAVLTIDNPWRKITDPNVPVSEDVLVKFWPQLVEGGIVFTVNGEKGIAQSGIEFEEVINSDINVLGLSKDASDKVTLNGAIVKDSAGNDVTITTAVIADGVYHTGA